MTNYTFKCNNCDNEMTIQASMSEGPPPAGDIECDNCGQVGAMSRVWTKNNVIWAASGFYGTQDLDQQRARGEYIVPRKD